MNKFNKISILFDKIDCLAMECLSTGTAGKFQDALDKARDIIWENDPELNYKKKGVRK